MAVTYKDYYKTLGVSREASKEEIAKAFKKLARQHHPDLNPDNAAAEDKFKEINEAYEVLKDDEKRRLYDQLGPDWQQGQQFRNAGYDPSGGSFRFNGQKFDGAGFSDFFETLFGNAGQQGGRSGFGADPFGRFSQQPQRGRDIEASLEVTLEEAVKGGEKSLTLQGMNGEPRTLKVTIPAGIRDGGKLRLNGQGNESINGGPKGDLYLKVRLGRHPEFHVDGNDLVHEICLLPWEAALGTKVRVPTLEGAVELSVPSATDSGRKFRLKGKGLGKPGERGDIFVRIGIRMPKDMTDRQRELWEALAAEAAAK